MKTEEKIGISAFVIILMLNIYGIFFGIPNWFLVSMMIVFIVLVAIWATVFIVSKSEKCSQNTRKEKQ